MIPMKEETGREYTLLREHWVDMNLKGALMTILGLEGEAHKHLAASTGRLKFPFPSGTGYPGLIEACEGLAKSKNTV